VKRSFVAALALLVTALSAHADERPTAQWRPVKQSLADLVGAGYTVVAIKSEPPSEGLSMEIFFLQKGTSLCKCGESHVNDVKARKSTALFSCWELVQPYAVAPSR
jgi:hypothetical protein